ncbi:hypothetical protein PG997_005432 [Apiospora hydei]|uniref:Uncharacterized protein n=1 Tax=Apiospora hydei TaxID=1337664 RepID=A0ABR1X4X2_9PEZI
MVGIENNAGGASAADGSDVNLSQLPSSLEVLDSFIDKLTPKPLLHAPAQGRRYTDGFENPPPASSIVWTAISDAETYGITTTVKGAAGPLVAGQMFSDRVRERIGDYEDFLHLAIRRQLHLERDSVDEVWSVTQQIPREGVDPVAFSAAKRAEAEAEVEAGAGINRDPSAVDPLDEFVDRLTPLDEDDDEEFEDLDDEDDERMDIEDHPPIIWTALPNDCVTTLVDGWDGYKLAQQIFRDRVEELIGGYGGPTVVCSKLAPAGCRNNYVNPHHFTMWIVPAEDSERGWIQLGHDPRIYTDGEPEYLQED